MVSLWFSSVFVGFPWFSPVLLGFRRFSTVMCCSVWFGFLLGWKVSNCPAGQPRHRAKDREFRAKHKGRMSQGSVAIGSTERVCWGIKGTVLFRKPRISQSKTQSLVEDHFSVILVWCCTICGFQSSLYNVFRSVKPKLFGCITSLHVL